MKTAGTEPSLFPPRAPSVGVERPPASGRVVPVDRLETRKTSETPVTSVRMPDPSRREPSARPVGDVIAEAMALLERQSIWDRRTAAGTAVGTTANPAAQAQLGGTNAKAPVNPIPTNTPTNFASATDFIKNFRFGQDDLTGDPVADLARSTFNQIADQYGHNAAWTFALSSAWNDLAWGRFEGGAQSGRGIYDASSGLGEGDIQRIINTYSSASKATGYFGDEFKWTNPSRGFFNEPGSTGEAFAKLVNAYTEARLRR